MRGVHGPVRTPRTIFSFRTPHDAQQIATGCDGDQGGLSTVNFDHDSRPEIHASLGNGIGGSARFWGDMRLKVKPEVEGKVRGGWAGFRNKVSFQISYNERYIKHFYNLCSLDQHSLGT